MNRARPAVFFDRDGVLNVDNGYVSRVEDFTWVEGAREAIALCGRLGYLTVVVTNQSGVGRGYYDEAAVHKLHGWMAQQARAAGAQIDGFYYCPHHPQATVVRYRMACSCRKPAPGMLASAIRDLNVEVSRSLLVGDKPSDLAAANAASLRGVLFRGGSLLHLLEQSLVDVLPK